MGRLLSLIVIAGLAYGGLYVYYGMAATQAIEQQLEARGLGALTVESVDYGPLAPLTTDTHLSTSVRYRGANASLDIRMLGHPVFSDEVRLELDGLQALRLTIGTGG
nr:YdgA family protein [Halomonas socia]